MPGEAENDILAMEQAYGVSMDYWRHISRVLPSALARLEAIGGQAALRTAAPVSAQFLACLGAVHAEDCGPCVQIYAREAVREGVNRAWVASALEGRLDELPEAEVLAFRFGQAVATGAEELDDLRGELVARLGEAAVVDLAIGAAAARFWPALKRGLGFASACNTAALDF